MFAAVSMGHVVAAVSMGHVVMSEYSAAVENDFVSANSVAAVTDAALSVAAVA